MCLSELIDRAKFAEIMGASNTIALDDAQIRRRLMPRILFATPVVYLAAVNHALDVRVAGATIDAALDAGEAFAARHMKVEVAK
jgi:hypothetical protein